MGAKTKIEWTRGADGTPGATWTPIRARNKATGKLGWHCEHASPGCLHCYSESLNRDRLGTRLPFKPGHRADVEIFLDETMLTQPLRWAKPRMIFVCSMTDLFADFVPDEWIDRVFAVMALAPQHTFQVLTKRSARMRAYFAGCGERADFEVHGLDRLGTTAWRFEEIRQALKDVALAAGAWDRLGGVKTLPLPNVWLGVSCEDQRRADERVPDLLATPAAVRFVSAEPLIGPIDFANLTTDTTPLGWIDALRCYVPRRLDWVIVGGESGPNARPMHPRWARDIRDQCAAAGVAYFFKQWGEWAPHAYNGTLEGQACVWPDGTTGNGGADEKDGPGAEMDRVGKSRAGRLLDGVEHNGMPEVRV